MLEVDPSPAGRVPSTHHLPLLPWRLAQVLYVLLLGTSATGSPAGGN